MVTNRWKAAAHRPLRDSPIHKIDRRLLALRKRLEITQQQLAAMLRVRLRTIEAWESGRSTPPPEFLERIVKVLDTARSQSQGSGAEAKLAAELISAFQSDESAPRATIIVADDNPKIRRALASTLRKEGYDVAEVEDGSQLQETVLGVEPDLILLDIVMPGLDGFQALRILSGDSRTREIPVVILSATGRRQDFELAKALGARVYLTKPWAPGEVERTVAWELGRFESSAGGVTTLGRAA